MTKHQPQRSCLGCRAVGDKGGLLRFVLDSDRDLVPDLQARLPGRGAYTCWDPDCVRVAVAKRQFSRSFKGEVKSPDARVLVERIGEMLLGRIGGYIALANKAGKVVSGSDMVEEAIRRRKPGLLVIASDTSPENGERFRSLADKAGIPHAELFDKGRLGGLLGKELRSVAVIEQGGFIAPLLTELARYRNFTREGCTHHE